MIMWVLGEDTNTWRNSDVNENFSLYVFNAYDYSFMILPSIGTTAYILESHQQCVRRGEVQHCI